MSLDLRIGKEEFCNECGSQDKFISSFNYTYNVSSMWYKVFPEDCTNGMVYIDGMRGKQAKIKLQTAIDYMENNKEELEKLNPKNSWGSYDSFLNFIRELLRASMDNPEAFWEGDR